MDNAAVIRYTVFGLAFVLALVAWNRQDMLMMIGALLVMMAVRFLQGEAAIQLNRELIEEEGT